LSVVDYHNLKLDRHDKALDERLNALGELERDKLRVARPCNKILKEKYVTPRVTDLVIAFIKL
jgi:hypothetical protein